MNQLYSRMQKKKFYFEYLLRYLINFTVFKEKKDT